jgi:hypothetical protein
MKWARLTNGAGVVEGYHGWEMMMLAKLGKTGYCSFECKRGC